MKAYDEEIKIVGIVSPVVFLWRKIELPHLGPLVVFADELERVVDSPNIIVVLGEVVPQLKFIVFLGELVLNAIEFVILQFVLFLHRHVEHFLEGLAPWRKLDVAVDAVKYFS